MIPTPESISRLLQEEIRHEAMVQTRMREAKTISRPQQIWTAFTAAVSRDWLTSTLFTMAAIGFVIAVVLMLASWPIGGGREVSEAAIAQGASLIFVVILIGLLGPAVEAGRSIGWDASWIRNDPLTWLSLMFVTGISLFLVWLGSGRPERPEEVATIFLTATGLAITALLARRMIGFADPAVQLAERRRREARTIAKLVDEAAEQSQRALSRVGVEAEVALPIASLAPAQVQQRVAESIKRVLATSRTAWHRGEWVLAAQAHVQAIVLSMQYAESVEALSGEDRVFDLIRNETDDLHEMAGGPAGRWLSLTVLQNLVECAVAVVNTQKAAMPHHESDQLAHYFAMTIENLVRRRLGDMKAQDIYAGVDGVKRLALTEVMNSHPWGAASIAKLGLKWAPPGVEAGMAHVAWPAWSCGIEVIKSLALVEDVEGLALRSLSDDFIDALANVTKVPHTLTNGLEPIIGHWVSESTLVGLGYTVWQAPESRLKDIARLTDGVSGQIVRLIANTDDSWQHATSKDGADVLYHFVAACATRLESEELEASSRSIAYEALGNGLDRLRRLVVDEDDVNDQYATRDLLHIYLSAWQLGLFVVRNQSDLPSDLRAEHARLMDALTVGVLGDLPSDLIDEGLRRLGAWLEKESHEDLARTTEERRKQIPKQAVRAAPFATWGWGFGDEYHTYRGSMMGGFFDRVEDHFTG